MALKTGTRLGPHEILSLLGAGGMGEVYKARDTRLERIVALKVLPLHLADRPEVRERFEREARTIANLKHPNICVLYDIGKQDGIDYLVLEYLEGETLAQRLQKGPLPLEQVLRYAIEISDALDKAHRAGVTHRDIKPGNIMLTKEGSKLLDFGLAKLKQEAAPIIPRSELPTGMGAPTAQGTLLGTLQYMAPEQVEGKVDELDGRTDIFAFGAVVYEMVTGKKAFEGQTQASVISKILQVDPPSMSSLQPMTPTALDRVVKRCLAKDREDRWQAARDLCPQLKWIAEGGSQTALPAPVVAMRKRRERLLAVAAALLFLATLAMTAFYFRRPTAEPTVTRLSVLPPENATLSADPLLSISPDGRRLAFLARDSSRKVLIWVRPLDSLQAQPLAGAEGASADISFPFWSPDSRFLGFFAEGKLKKIEVSGGPPQTLANSAFSRGGTWNQDGVIVFTPSPTEGLSSVSAAGGPVSHVTTLDASRRETSHRWPHFLPAGRHFLYFNRSPESGIYVGSLDSKETKRLLNVSSNIFYASPGYLVFARERTLMAQPFDARRIQLTGEAFPIAEGVLYNSAEGKSAFAVSQNGVLAYRTGPAIANQFAWMDRAGKELGRFGDGIGGSTTNHLSLSPEENRVALEMTNSEGHDLWLHDLSRGTTSRFARGLLSNSFAWSADGNWLTFATARAGGAGLYQKLSSGAGQEELLLSAPDVHPTDRSQDGRFLLYVRNDPKTRYDLWVLPLFGDRKPKPFLQTEFDEGNGQFSPDGRWVAYVSNESGRLEVYVQPFPGPGPKWQVSTNGGILPKWRRDGKELFYLNQGAMMSVEVKAGAQFEASAPRLLFEAQTTVGQAIHNGDHYVVTADGKRFLFIKPKEETSAAPITVVLNWTAGIKKQ